MSEDCARPVLEGVFDEVVEWDDEAAEIPDFDDDVGRVDLFDATPLALNDDDVVDANGFGEGNLQAGEEVGSGGFGGGGEDEGGDAGGGEQAGAVVPDARVVEGPQESADVDDDDKGDEHSAEELELGMDAAGPEVIFGGEVVAAQHEGLQDVDAADGEPAEGDDHQHDECLPQHGFDVLRKVRDGGQNDEQAGEKKDCASGFSKVLAAVPSRGGG